MFYKEPDHLSLKDTDRYTGVNPRKPPPKGWFGPTRVPKGSPRKPPIKEGFGEPWLPGSKGWVEAIYSLNCDKRILTIYVFFVGAFVWFNEIMPQLLDRKSVV